MTPEYAARIAQLEAGEVDMVPGIRADDADRLAQGSSNIVLLSSTGRDYDFIGWNNIDQETFAASRGKTIRPHALFGSTRVRRALTMAINREEIVRAYLGRYGRPSFGGVSPLFTWAYNDSIQPLPFAPNDAIALLTAEGWRDTDGDGVVDKGGKPFRFVLKLASGNPLRTTIASVIQQQLGRVGIGVTIELVESGTFWGDLMARKYDAWYAGFSIPLQLQLEEMWGADLAKFPFNLTGFRHPRVTQIFKAIGTLPRESDGASLWKEFQAIVHEEQPCTFLYWSNSIVGVHKRVKGLEPSVVAITHGSWEWTTE
jgi:peptide/nickel transport system substrate-binding protein